MRIRNAGVAGLIPQGVNSPIKIRNALRRNCLVGMLVDQYDANGIEVRFFRRNCRVNSMLGRMARLFECPDLRRPRGSTAQMADTSLR